MDHLKTVLIADGSEEFCASLRSAFKQVSGFQVIGTASDGEQAIHMVQQLKPDVLVASIIHGSASVIPGGDSQFVPGDRVVVVTSRRGSLQQMGDIFA